MKLPTFIFSCLFFPTIFLNLSSKLYLKKKKKDLELKIRFNKLRNSDVIIKICCLKKNFHNEKISQKFYHDNCRVFLNFNEIVLLVNKNNFEDNESKTIFTKIIQQLIFPIFVNLSIHSFQHKSHWHHLSPIYLQWYRWV